MTVEIATNLSQESFFVTFSKTRASGDKSPQIPKTTKHKHLKLYCSYPVTLCKDRALLPHSTTNSYRWLDSTLKRKLRMIRQNGGRERVEFCRHSPVNLEPTVMGTLDWPISFFMSMSDQLWHTLRTDEGGKWSPHLE